jgi:uroporphyrinogen-III decarboxylase
MTYGRGKGFDFGEQPETTKDQQKVYLSWMDDAYSCAIRNLGRYKFDRFGYFSARWVTLNKLGVELGLFDKKQPNPFKDLVDLAKRIEVFERLT